MRRAIRKLVPSRSPSPAGGGSSSNWETAKEAFVLVLETAKNVLDAVLMAPSGVKVGVAGLIDTVKRIDVSAVLWTLIPSSPVSRQ